MRAARLHEYTDEMGEALEPDDVPRPETTAADIVALVERGGGELRTNRNDLDEINEVAERLEHGEIEGRAVITP